MGVEVSLGVAVWLGVGVGVHVSGVASATRSATTHGVAVGSVGVGVAVSSPGVEVAVWTGSVGWDGVDRVTGGSTESSLTHNSGSSPGCAPQMDAQVLSSSKMALEGKYCCPAIGSPASGWSKVS